MDDKNAGHEAPLQPVGVPAALYYGLDTTAEPSAFGTAEAAEASPHPVELNDPLPPSDDPVGSGGGLPPPVPFYKSRQCVKMACCCCCSSCVILLGIALGIVIPIGALLASARVSAERFHVVALCENPMVFEIVVNVSNPTSVAATVRHVKLKLREKSSAEDAQLMLMQNAEEISLEAYTDRSQQIATRFEITPNEESLPAAIAKIVAQGNLSTFEAVADVDVHLWLGGISFNFAQSFTFDLGGDAQGPGGERDTPPPPGEEAPPFCLVNRTCIFSIFEGECCSFLPDLRATGIILEDLLQVQNQATLRLKLQGLVCSPSLLIAPPNLALRVDTPEGERLMSFFTRARGSALEGASLWASDPAREYSCDKEMEDGTFSTPAANVSNSSMHLEVAVWPDFAGFAGKVTNGAPIKLVIKADDTDAESGECLLQRMLMKVKFDLDLSDSSSSSAAADSLSSDPPSSANPLGDTLSDAFGSADLFDADRDIASRFGVSFRRYVAVGASAFQVVLGLKNPTIARMRISMPAGLAVSIGTAPAGGGGGVVSAITVGLAAFSSPTVDEKSVVEVPAEVRLVDAFLTGNSLIGPTLAGAALTAFLSIPSPRTTTLQAITAQVLPGNITLPASTGDPLVKSVIGLFETLTLQPSAVPSNTSDITATWTRALPISGLLIQADVPELSLDVLHKGVQEASGALKLRKGLLDIKVEMGMTLRGVNACNPILGAFAFQSEKAFEVGVRIGTLSRIPIPLTYPASLFGDLPLWQSPAISGLELTHPGGECSVSAGTAQGNVCNGVASTLRMEMDGSSSLSAEIAHAGTPIATVAFGNPGSLALPKEGCLPLSLNLASSVNASAEQRAACLAVGTGALSASMVNVSVSLSNVCECVAGLQMCGSTSLTESAWRCGLGATVFKVCS